MHQIWCAWVHQMTPKFGRVPIEVSCDERLRNLDVRLYGFMAAFTFHGNACEMSLQQMAEACHTSRRSIMRALDRLVECGYIVPGLHNRERQRSFYALTSKIFGQRQGKEDVIVRSKHGSRYVSMDNASHGLPPREEAV